jgi:hypothetical protein
MPLRRAERSARRGYPKPSRIGECALLFQTFIALVEQACAAVGARNSIPAEEVVRWTFVGDLRISPRGAKEVLTAPVVELGRAMIALLLGELPEAPKGEAWFYGTPDGRSTIRMNASWDGRW